MNEQSKVGPDSAAPSGKRPAPARGTAFKVGALVLATLCLVIGAACWLHKGEKAEDAPQGTAGDDGSGLFFGWDTPLFAVVLSAQEHGYLQPCGCSDPQIGGLERRYNFLQSLRLPKDKGGRGWPVVAYDLGDIAQTQAPAKLANTQALIKYHYSMDALKIMGYSAVSFGESEASLPLSAAMDEYALNEGKPPVLALNLLGKDKQFPLSEDDIKHTGPGWDKSYVGSWATTQVTPAIKVGAVGVIGTHDPAAVAALVAAGKLPKGVAIPPSVGSVITASEPKTKFDPADKAIAAGVTTLKGQNTDFRVLLYQGPVELAKLIPLADPDFNIILCVSQEDEPPGRPEVVKTAKGETWVVRVGHKGKNLGVVGVFRGKAGTPFDMKYELVRMDPRYKTPAGQENKQPIIDLMERYTRELKREDYLSKNGKVPHSLQAAIRNNPKLAAFVKTSGYVGSAKCQDCHPTAFKVWAGSKHSQAYGSLVNAKHPSLRDYDPECVVCHTVGFRYQDGFANLKATPNLKDVGCESCHGPGEAHVKRPRDLDIRALINPYKAPAEETPKDKLARERRIEGMCMECHDHENDVTWVDDPTTKEAAFSKKWKHVEHMTPPDEKKKRDGAGE